VIPEGDSLHISNAQAVFREDNAEQRSVIFHMKLPERAAQAGAHLSRIVRVDFLLVSVAFALFVFSAIREVRWRRREIHQRIIESEELRVARDEAARMAESAESADRAKSSFLAMMSHEIRTPLNAIMGYAQLLEQRPQDKDTSEGLAVIKQSGVVLQRVLNDILDFSKIEAGKLAITPQVISLRELAAESIATFRNQAESKGNHLSVETQPDVPEWLLADGTRLKQVIYNVLSNAVKFTDGGAIVVSIQRAHGPMGAGGKSFSGDAQWIRISIRDEGIGVSEADEGILFEPFSQIDSSVGRRYDGTGLGLAISRRLCHLMGGDIVFERLEKGSNFTISFPAEAAVGPDLLAAPDVGEVRPSAGFGYTDLRILVVDDNLVNARLLAAILRKFGCNSEVALSGEAAVDFVQREQPDLIFMDIQMPRVDGLEATRRIREIEVERGLKRCQIVAVTADILDTNRTSALAAGMDGYLSKPVKLERIEEVLAGVHPLNGAEVKT
ncbi:MAG: response regulator, partial [Chthoniobacterales bacterium]